MTQKNSEQNHIDMDDESGVDDTWDILEEILAEAEEELAQKFCPKSADPHTFQQFVEKALQAVNDPQTERQELSDYADHYNNELEIAKAVARHPNCDDHLLARMLYWLPEDAQQNPKLQQTEYQSEEWQQKVKQANPDGAKPKSKWVDWTNINYQTVNLENPELFKILYYLEQGSDKDRAYVLGLNNVSTELCADFLDSRSANVRKALAMRERLPDGGFIKLAKDKAKTIRLAVANNSNATEDALALLCDDALPEITQAAINNPACPEQAVQQAKLKQSQQPKLHEKGADKLKLDEIRQLLLDRETESAAIDGLSQHQHAWVRYASGLHPNASVKTLEKLADDPETWVRESAAFNANTPTAILDSFAERSELSIKLALAANPATPETTQLKLAEFGNNQLLLALLNQSEHESVWHKVLETCQTKQDKKQKWEEYLALVLNPKTKAGKLRTLSRGVESRHLFVQRIIARHPNCAPSLKGQFAQYCYSDLVQNPSIALEILENPQAIEPESCAEWIIKEWGANAEMPGHVSRFFLQGNDSKLARLAVDSWTSLIRDQQRWVLSDDIHVRKRIANKCTLNRFMYETLAHDPKESVRELIAKKKTRFAKSAQHLAKDKSTVVRAALAQNKSVKKTGVQVADNLEIANKGPKRQRIKLAKEATDSNILLQLVNDRAIEVRRAVSQNKNTNSAALQQLFELLQQEEDIESLQAISSRANTPLVILESLSTHVDEEIRRRVAYRPEITPVLVEQFLVDSAPRVRFTAMKRFETWKNDQRVFSKPEILARMSEDTDASVRSIVAMYSNDPEIHQRYSKDNSVSVRKALATNPHLEDTISLFLADDEQKMVREALGYQTSSLEALRALLKHEDTELGYFICSNDHFTKKQRLAFADECLVLDNDFAVQTAVTIYQILKKTPEKAVCVKLAQHPNHEIRNQLLYLSETVKFPGFPAEVKQVMLEHPTSEIAESWMGNLSEQQLIHMAQHAGISTRQMLAEYSTNKALLLFLAKDNSEDVRIMLEDNASINDEIRALLTQTA